MSKIVTFEQAKKLKELGFDVECLYYYDIKGEIEQSFYIDNECKVAVDDLLFNFNKDKCTYFPIDAVSAPTVSDSLDWVRENKGVACSVSFVFKYNDTTDNVDVQYFGQVLQTFPQFIDQVTEDFDTHLLASSALLDAVLTYLEEKK